MISLPVKQKQALTVPATRRDLLRQSFDYFNGNENRLLFSWKRFGLPPNVAAGGAIQVRNPVNSNIIAVIEKLSLIITTANGTVTVYQGFANTDIAPILTGTNG